MRKCPYWQRLNWSQTHTTISHAGRKRSDRREKNETKAVGLCCEQYRSYVGWTTPIHRKYNLKFDWLLVFPIKCTHTRSHLSFPWLICVQLPIERIHAAQHSTKMPHELAMMAYTNHRLLTSLITTSRREYWPHRFRVSLSYFNLSRININAPKEREYIGRNGQL